jgi:hypothetical protein
MMINTSKTPGQGPKKIALLLAKMQISPQKNFTKGPKRAISLFGWGGQSWPPPVFSRRGVCPRP